MNQTTSQYRFWPLVVFILASLSIDYSVFPGLRWLSWFAPAIPPDGYIMTAMGFLIGQSCFTVLISGALHRNWLVGFCLGTLLSVIGGALLIAGQLSQYSMMMSVSGMEYTTFWGLTIVPIILLGACVPFFAGRFFWGTHLTRNDEKLFRQGHGIREFLVNTAIVGALLFMARVPQAAWELRGNLYWPFVAGAFGFLAAVSCLLVLPLGLSSFRAPKKWRWVLYSFFVLIAGAFGFISNNYVIQGATSPWWFSAFAGGILPLAFFAIGVFTLRKAGFELVSYSKLPVPEVSPSSESDPFEPETPGIAENETHVSTDTQRFAPGETNVEAKRQDTASRVLSIAIISCAILGSFTVSYIESSRNNTDRTNRQLATEVASEGGEVETQSHKIVRLRLPETGGDETLAAYAHLSELNSLDLSNTKITDTSAATISRFRNLKELDLSNTNISPLMLSGIASLQLEKLNIAGTKLSVDEVLEFQNSKRAAYTSIQGIDVSNMNWSFEDLKRFYRSSYPLEFSIRGYSLNDAQLLELFFFQDNQIHCSLLDVRDNQLDGSFLGDVNGMRWGTKLRLEGNPITDAALAAAFKKNPTLSISQLSLGNNQLTDTGLALLGKSIGHALQLGDGKYTAKGLEKLFDSGMQLSDLKLNSKQFTGASLLKMQKGTYLDLDLSHSGITDAEVNALHGILSWSINLSHTNISDAALPDLAMITSPGVIDLSHTKVTAKGLMRGDLAGFREVHVAVGQFTEDEIEDISKAVGLKVGCIPMANF